MAVLGRYSNQKTATNSILELIRGAEKHIASSRNRHKNKHRKRAQKLAENEIETLVYPVRRLCRLYSSTAAMMTSTVKSRAANM